MKTMQKLLSFAALALLTMSCADMDSANNSMSENAPADFDATVYATLNPDVANFQIRDAVKSLNNKSGIKVGSKEYIADTDDFLADTAWMHVLITQYIGYVDSLWTGVPDKERTFLLEYNQLGKSVAEDRAYVESFSYDLQILMFHFGIVGQKEGRPYKICEDGHYGAERDPAVHAQNPSDKIPDYRPNLFCALDNHIYLIQ